MTDDFVHLHVHTEYSLLDGACRLDGLISRVAELGQKAVAITDHGAMYGVVSFYNEAKKRGIKPIIGCEIYVAPRTRFDKVFGEDSHPFHLVLLCENNEGYRNLIQLVSRSYTEGFYGKPRADLELLRQYSGGLICLSACLAGELPRLLSENRYEDAKRTALLYQEIFGKDNYFIEIQNHRLPEQLKILPKLLRLSKETGIPLVATNDCHYITREDSALQRLLICIQTGTTVNEPSKLNFETDEFYVKSTAEMRELFGAYDGAIGNTAIIAERCNVSFEFGVIKLPEYRREGVSDNVAFFRELCENGLKAKYPNAAPAVHERLEYELRIISQMGYVDYFLIVWDYIAYARSQNIPVGPGRGSGAGSLCAYCVGITDIDPIEYNLLFERFLNPERVSMPDFDVDFCIEGRAAVIEYVRRRYGEDRVSQIAAFDTMKARGAIRDAGRAMGIPYAACDKAAKLISHDFAATIDSELQTEGSQLKAYYESDKTVASLIDMARRIEGMPRHISTHAAGVIISAQPIRELVPLQKNDDTIITQFEMKIVESLGLLKMDFLGLKNLTIIRDCVAEIHRHEPDFSIDKIDRNAAPVYSMLSAGRTQGVFQYESPGMTNLLKRLRPVCLEDLIAAISLFRPGPMESIPQYIANRRRPEGITYSHQALEPILNVTSGCILYQEQVMEIFRRLAGYSYGRADLVRRAMAKKKHDVMEHERDCFINGEIDENGNVTCAGCVRNGIPSDVANDIFNRMTAFASYAFNKSHAAAYAYLAYQTAYLKCFYFGEYMAALMTGALLNRDKLGGYIAECENQGIKLLPPSVNESYDGFTKTENGIRFGLRAVKNLGTAMIKGLIEERERGGAFTSLEDFCVRLADSDLTRRGTESLIKAGAFDCFGQSRRALIEFCDICVDDALSVAKDSGSQLTFIAPTEIMATRRSFVPREEYPLENLLEMEREVTGMYISGHPTLGYRWLGMLLGAAEICDLAAAAESEATRCFICSVVSQKAHLTRSKERMCFLTVEDNSSEVECVVFPDLFRRRSQSLTKGTILLIRGKPGLREDRNDESAARLSVVCEDIIPESEMLSCIKGKRLCVKVPNNDATLIQTIISRVSAYKGDTRLTFFIASARRELAPKPSVGVEVCEALINDIKTACPEAEARLV